MKYWSFPTQRFVSQKRFVYYTRYARFVIVASL